jgi:hypothetical protein
LNSDLKNFDSIAALFDHARKKLGPGASVRDLATWVTNSGSEEGRLNFEATGNPVHVWRLLARLPRIAARAAKLDPTLAGIPFAGGIPVWVQAYLAQVGSNISRLASGFDHRDPDADYSWYNLGNLSSAQAIGLIGQALGLSKRGWSAFGEYQNERLAEMFVDIIWTDEAAATGVPVFQRIEEFREAAGLADERDARRRIAEVRNRRAPGQMGGRIIPPK